MKLTTQRKVTFSVLGVAAAALILDKTLLAPEGASAAAMPAPDPQTLQVVGGTAPAATMTQAKPDPAGTPSGKLASRLSIALDSPKWSADQVVGSLRPSPEWATGADRPVTAQAGHHFSAKHSLRAVMGGKSEDNRIALVDGKPVKVGQVLDGYTLVQVGARSAVFEAGADRVVLYLTGVPEPSAAAPDR